MSIFDDIRKDAEAGTPGPWNYYAGDICARDDVLVVAAMGRSYGLRSDIYSSVRLDTPAGNANARRIARVPQLEAIALAALDPDWIAQRIREIDGDHTKGAGQIGEELAAAFREATE